MLIPLDKLLQRSKNIYELTCAGIKRASQLTITGEKDGGIEETKIVPMALRQILTEKVEYRLEE
ncbi:MAG: DNA-directed RNA polymerase subunit omega [Spirochaetaceae bacterium]|nr:DNA-directed RNA polymerase subunit omega [Spirochaetaceae bacterium]